MALVGHGSLQRGHPHHESNSTLLGPHVPSCHQDIASAEGGPFEAGGDLETRREGGRVRNISINIEGRTSEDKLIPAAKYPNFSQRTPFDLHLRRERQSKSIFVSIPTRYCFVASRLPFSSLPPPALACFFSPAYFCFDVIHGPRLCRQ